MKKEVLGFECKHSMYTKANDGSDDDLITIKEVVHYKDGTTEPRLRFLKNFKRDFYVTKEGFRNHTDKKEWEDLSKVQKFTTTQANLNKSVARALGNPAARGGLKALARSPFLYGTDQTPTAIVKSKYKKKYPDLFSPNTVAVLDIETDVVQGHKRPILIALTFKDKVYLGATKEFIGDMHNPEEKIRKRTHELLGKYIEERNINLEIEICDNAGQMLANAISRGHKWQPDFITIWNIDFDIPYMIKTLEYYNYNLAEVFSDPSVPKRFKSFSYKQGKTKKTTAKGDVHTVPFQERWHKVECPASFHFIDSMCTYRRIRLAAQQENSYSLDYQLNKHLKLGKLKFEEAEHIPPNSLEWHAFLQSNYKVEYAVYNIFDCIAVELFDEKLGDLAFTISIQAGVSDFNYFDQQPRRLVDQLVEECAENGLVIASCSNEMKTELDNYVVGRNDWVITMPSHTTTNEGLFVLNDLPNLRSRIYTHTADLDIVSSYPHNQLILNMSKETTFRELSKIEGLTEVDKRMVGINMTSIRSNGVELAQSLYKVPDLETMLEAFVNQ